MVLHRSIVCVDPDHMFTYVMVQIGLGQKAIEIYNNAVCIKLRDPDQTATETQISVGCILLVVGYLLFLVVGRTSMNITVDGYFK